MRLQDIVWDHVPVTEVVGADPAIEVDPSGAPYVLTVPAGKEWRVHAVYFSLVTSADAGNRASRLLINAPAGTVWTSLYGLTVTASQTKLQSWVRNSQITTAGTQYGLHIPPIDLPAGWTMNVYVSLFDTVAAGDDAGPLTARVQERSR